MIGIRRYTLVIISLISLISLPLYARSNQIDLGAYYALLIGNEEYNNTMAWRKLGTPHADVDALGKMLKNGFGFEVIVKKDLTRGKIIDLIEDYKSKLSENDNLLIYYAGHGYLRSDGGYWIGVNGKKKSRSDWLKYTTISDLIDRQSGMKAKHVIVISDSCYSGAAYRNKNDFPRKDIKETEFQWIKRIVTTPTRIIITSGGNQPVVDKLGNSEHSIFAEELLNKLNSVVTKNGIIIGQDLHRLISPEVHYRTKRVLGDAQSPEYKKIPGTGDLGGDFLFRSTNSYLPEEEIVQSDPFSALTTRGEAKDKIRSSRMSAIKSKAVRAIIFDSHIYEPGDTIQIRILTNSSKVRSFALFDFEKIYRAEAKFSKNVGTYIKFTIPNNATYGSYDVEIYVQELSTSYEEKHVISFNVGRMDK